MDTKPILVTWTFDTREMKPIKGCYLELVEKRDLKSAKMIFLRVNMSAGAERASLFHVPKDWTREEYDFFFDNNPTKDIMDKLHNSEVRESDIMRAKDPRGNAVDFLKF